MITLASDTVTEKNDS